MKAIGLMSGTSCDGVTACISDLCLYGEKIKSRLISWLNVEYPQELRSRLLSCCAKDGGNSPELCHLNFAVAHAFVDAAKKVAVHADMPIESIDFIASHGQTIWHDPMGRTNSSLPGKAIPSTLQIGEASVIAERTGITVVSDFRSRDIAAGGLGAPLVPFADLMMFAHPDISRVVQNIGGIANLTWLPPGAGVDNLVAFDTGPGNMVIDGIVQMATNDEKQYDDGGAIALSGRVNDALLAELMSHPYFNAVPPKTTGREDFGKFFSRELYAKSLSHSMGFNDLVATVTEWTAASIASACERFIGPADEMIVCGGGSMNRAIMNALRQRLTGFRQVVTMDETGFPAHAKESHSFAILGFATIMGMPSNVPAATGAGKRVILGRITPGRGFSAAFNG
ncbi:MAG TPA: anhydro-N-acetylmuramic acid kinase [Candidatus Brocadiia bacterium]|nr:anhydro-N-acetylmuramic acid kinase [Candidatus Brocadiia bacterium]